MKYKIVVIIVTYNGRKWIDNCLKSVLNSDIELYPIVIDNASTDGTANYIRRNFLQVQLIESGENLGFGQANNIGLKKAIDENADYVMLLNQDAWLETTTIDLLIKEQIRNPSYWILSPMQKNSMQNAIEYQFNKYIQKNKIDIDKNIVHEIDYVNAAIWLINNKCIKNVGGFDPLFPHYGEDNDYVNRVHYWGGKVGVVTEAIAYHDRETVGRLENDKQIYKTTLAITGLLKDINNSLFHNVVKEIYRLMIKSIKYILKWDIVSLQLYNSAFIRAILRLNRIKKHRNESTIKGAFLNLDRKYD